jgi:hypothetical protein
LFIISEITGRSKQNFSRFSNFLLFFQRPEETVSAPHPVTVAISKNISVFISHCHEPEEALSASSKP